MNLIAGDDLAPPPPQPTLPSMGVAADARAARQPTAPPPFTLGALRKAIPARCFERPLARSAAYLAADLAALLALAAAALYLDASPALPPLLRWGALWPAYWIVAGAVATGVWVIAHECGHGAFSAHPRVNDAVGLVLHSALLVPYYSWKHSHRRHHSNTASLERDEVFVPAARTAPDDSFDATQLWPVRLLLILNTLLVGWPAYLLFNAAGRPYPSSSRGVVSHFDPWSPIFSRRERAEVAASDAALALALGLLAAAGRTYGWPTLVCVYGAPYLIVNAWLVTITFLQHAHPALPHYAGAEWDWLRGALATVDRSFGRLLDALHHDIANHHVVHHLFSAIPHYNAAEATAALRPLLGAYYVRDGRGVGRALWEDWRACRYVAPDVGSEKPGVLWQRE